VAGGDLPLAVQRPGEQLGGGVVGVAPLGRLGRPHGVADRLGGGAGRRGPEVVVGEGREVLGVQLLDGRGHPGVQAAAPQLGQVGVQGVAGQHMGEPDLARRRFGEQTGDQAGLQRVQHRRLAGPGRPHQHLDVGVPADHGGQAQHRHRRRWPPGQPSPQHVADALRHLGGGDQRALAGQQPHALPDIEGVAAGALGERGHGRRIQRLLVDGADELAHLRR
jgi:hypothetical protein